jgi:hypothetical protein
MVILPKNSSRKKFGDNIENGCKPTLVRFSTSLDILGIIKTRLTGFK